MKGLILDPMVSASKHDPNSSEWIFVVIIDGLDECASEDTHREVVNLLANSASSPFRFLIASRPEFKIRNTFSQPDNLDKTQMLALDNRYFPDADIRLFLSDKLQDIKATHPMQHSIPDFWPSMVDVDTLVSNASGQFIYATTVIRYIESPRHNPIAHLAAVVKSRSSDKQPDVPFTQLDLLYHEIFGAVVNREQVLRVLQVLMYGNNHYFNTCTKIEMLLEYSPGEVRLLLCDMHSLLHIQEEDHSSSLPYSGFVRPYHASLGDFLSDRTRSKHLYLSPKESQQFVFTSIIKQFNGMSLRFVYSTISFNNFLAPLPRNSNEMLWDFFRHALTSWDLCLTAETEQILSNFNIYKNISIDQFFPPYGNPDDPAPFSVINTYYNWLNSQVRVRFCIYEVIANGVNMNKETVLLSGSSTI